MKIGNRNVGRNTPPFLVAELSGNHRQEINRAKALIDAAAGAGADAVKLQTYTADTLTLPCRSEPFRVKTGLWKDRYLHDLYRQAMTPWDWHHELDAHARSRGLLLFSTPFDESAVDFLEETLDPPVYKIASFEVNHLPLLKRVASCRKPVIMSTGMATENEIEDAVRTLNEHGARGIALLKCISTYPADPVHFNLRSLLRLRKRFNCPVGLSDHSLSHEVALGSVALGATIIEKHLTLSRIDGAVDSEFSLEPQEFGEMRELTLRLHKALGDERLGPTSQEHEALRHRRSIFVARTVRAGDRFTAANLRVVRPADGLAPSYWERVLGSEATRDLEAGTPLQFKDVIALAS